MYESIGRTTSTGGSVIDLRSDTVTRPTPAMRDQMASADVGDDQYGEDPTVNALELKTADLLGKEAAVFVASGTMGNLSSILAHTQRGDEFIVGDQAHILHYESAAPATLGGVSPRSVRMSHDGTYDLDELRAAIRIGGPGTPPTGVICLENTVVNCAGAVIPLQHMRGVAAIAREYDIPTHLDGARIFNAAAALGVQAREIAATVDSVQLCLSKGLAAPVGSMVVGNAEFIGRVRRYRKMLGGAMRQAGVIAAAGLVALDTMVDRLTEDHERARRLAAGLATITALQPNPAGVQSNIVVVKPVGIDKATLISRCRDHDLLISDFGHKGVRLVTHYEITDDMVNTAIEVLTQVVNELEGEAHARS